MVRVHVVGCGPQTVQTVIVVVKPSGHPVPVVVGVAPTTEVMVLTVRQGTVVNPVLHISVYVMVRVVVIVVVLGSGHPNGVVVDVEAGSTGGQGMPEVVEEVVCVVYCHVQAVLVLDDTLEVAKLELDVVVVARVVDAELKVLVVVALVVTAPAVVEEEPVVVALVVTAPAVVVDAFVVALGLVVGVEEVVYVVEVVVEIELVTTVDEVVEAAVDDVVELEVCDVVDVDTAATVVLAVVVLALVVLADVVVGLVC